VRAGGFLSNATASSAVGDMPAKRRRQRKSSDAENFRTSDPEGPNATQLDSSKTNKNNRRTSSRRRPFPGENPPRLAATWRKTTSSRGAENTFVVGVQDKSDEVTASQSNISSSGTMVDGVQSPNELNIMNSGSISALEFNDPEEQQIGDSFLTDWLNFDEYLNLEADSGHSANCDVFENYPYHDSWAEEAMNGFGIGDRAQSTFSFGLAGNDSGGDSLLGDPFSASACLDIGSVARDIEVSRTPGSEVGRTMGREHMHNEAEQTQCKCVIVSSNSSKN
jgi:hypothetical protein